MRRFALRTHVTACRISIARFISGSADVKPAECAQVVAEMPSAPTKPAVLPLVTYLSTVATQLQSRNDLLKNATSTASTEIIPNRQICVDPEKLVTALSAYILREARLYRLCRSKVSAVRQHYISLRSRQPQLPPLHRDVLLHAASRAVERREVPLLLAARLLRPRWPEPFMDVTGSCHHAFLQNSLRAWVAERLKSGEMDASEARAVLAQCPHLFTGQVALLGSVVEAALVDLHTLTDAEPLIEVMWAVNNAGTHAPDHLWRRIVGRLAQLNRSMRSEIRNTADPVTEMGEKTKKANLRKSREKPAGHVFSGLTTRQLFRVLRVLKRERWCGDVATVFDFADKALKNMAFETQALSLVGDAKGSAKPMRQVSRNAISRRIDRASGLTPTELLSMLSIAGEIGIEYNASLSSVSDYLLTPLVRHMNREQLMMFTTCIRQFHCDSPSLVQAVMDEVAARGVAYPCSLAITKATLRTLLQKPALISQLKIAPFTDHIFSLCDTFRWSLRASQLLDWVETLYKLSRRYAPSSSMGSRIRSCVDSFAVPLTAMQEARLLPSSIASRVLEHSIILGMRGQPQYPLMERLREGHIALSKKEDITDEVPQVESDTFPDGTVKAVQRVYDELIYAYERQMIIRISLSSVEAKRFRETFSNVGLYNLFAGARLMAAVHLRRVDGAAARPIAFSLWTERAISVAIQTRLHDAQISTASHDEDLLRVLGQQRFNAAKARRFIQMIEESPLLLARQQRMLWVFAREVTRRFGDEEDKALVQKMLDRAMY